MFASLKIRELWIFVMQKNDIMIAAGAGTAAPLGTGVGNKAAVLGNLPNQLDSFLPALGGDVEIVMRERQNVQARDVTAIS